MKRVSLALLSAMALCLGAVAVAQQSPSAIVFCRSADFDSWQPVDPGQVFDVNVVSLMFETPEPFGANTLTLTEYKQVGGGETLTFRTDVAVSPEWGGFLVTDYVFPEPGMYRMTFARPDGVVIAEGMVEILMEQADITESDQPEELRTSGKTLGDYFNQYRPAQ